MKKSIALVLALVMLCAVALVGCGGEKVNKEEMKGSVAMVLSGLKTDEAFNQYTYEGMLRYAEESGVKTAFREEVSQDEQLEVIRQFAQQGYETIIGQGGQFGEALQMVAKEYPETNFIFSVGTDTGNVENLTAATVSYSHAGYLGGIMAAYTTKTNKVAMVTGEFYDSQSQMRDSFAAGVKAVNPDIEVVNVATGDWADVTTAREACLALISQGVDVLFPCLDAAYVGTLAAAEDSKDVWVVGSVTDFGAVNPDVVVGSVVFNWEGLGYVEATGKLCDGGVHIIGMADEGISPIINNLSEEGQAALNQAIEDLKAGKVDIKP